MVVGGWAWSSPLVRGRTGWTVYDVRPAIVPSRTPSCTASAPLPLVRPGPIQEGQVTLAIIHQAPNRAT
jgi:hypothetical protein